MYIHAVYFIFQDVDDDLCDLSTPTLFVVGEDSPLCNINDLEDMRERLLTKAQTSLIAVAGGNEHLCVSEYVRKQAGVNQSMIDKYVNCEILIEDFFYLYLG